MASAYYNNNNFIVLILVFIYLFIQQTFIEHPLGIGIIGENLMRSLLIQYSQSKETGNNQTLHEHERLYPLSLFLYLKMESKMPSLHG